MSPLSLAHLISGSRPWFPDTRGRWMCCCVRESSDKRFGKKRVNDGESEGAVAVGREREMGTHMNTLNLSQFLRHESKTRPGLRNLGFEMPVQIGVGEEQLPTRQHEVLPVPHRVHKVRPSPEMTRLRLHEMHEILTKYTKCLSRKLTFSIKTFPTHHAPEW